MKYSYIRKSIAMLVIFTFVSILALSSASAAPETIYETSTTQTITSGATLENIVRYTTSGWLNINVLRVDLSNPNIQVDNMSTNSSIQQVSSTKTLATARGAVAAINTGFFSFGAQSGTGFPIGTALESGQMITASSDLNRWGDELATLSISKLNQIMYNYWKTDITLIAPNGSSTPVARYNKNFNANTDFTILDSKWSSQTLGATPKAPDCVEMLVVDGIVTEIRQAQPAAPMPANGYVVVTRKAGGETLLNNFQIGDPVSLSIKTTPDWTSLNAAFTGGAMLIKDGQIPQTFSHIPEGARSTRNPRTAAGSTEDGKQLILVTVDGRQNCSIGMTLGELAQFMKEIGIYNALNFDGGGSTTMVARTPDSQALEIVNSPSDGSARRVSTALGIFSVAPPSALDGLLLDATSSNVFVNTSRTFNIKGFDRYYNPIAIDPTKIKWSVSGIDGEFIGSTFYPKSVGVGTIKATLDNISTTYEITALSTPVQLTLSTSAMQLSLGETKSLTVTGMNKNGYSAAIDPQDVKWTVKGNVGTMDKGSFTSSLGGTGYIDAAVGSTHAYCAVSVESVSTKTVDDFESLNGTYLPYPETVEGSYSISDEQKHNGNTSGKLSYKFVQGEGTRAAYMALHGSGLKLDPNTKKISLWVYNTHENPNWLGMWIYDAKGTKSLVYFTKSMDWVGWKQVEASIAHIKSPTSLGRFYLVQPNPVTDEGSIYLDELSVTTSTAPALNPSNLPANTVPVDDALKAVSFIKSSTAFRFAVFGQSSDPKTSLEKQLTTKLMDKIKKIVDIAAFVGDSQHSAAKSLKLPVVSTRVGYKSFDNAGSRFIQLDMSKKGLRLSNAQQWQWFLDQLNTATGSSVFIFLSKFLDEFTDAKERDLFKTLLSRYRQETGRTVWVFYQGSKNGSVMEKGIKYISSAGLDVPGITAKKTSGAQYILVTVKGSSVTYEFKPIS